MILGIDKFIADHLNVTVESFDPFNKIANDKEINNQFGDVSDLSDLTDDEEVDH